MKCYDRTNRCTNVRRSWQHEPAACVRDRVPPESLTAPASCCQNLGLICSSGSNQRHALSRRITFTLIINKFRVMDEARDKLACWANTLPGFPVLKALLAEKGKRDSSQRL